MRIVFTSAPFSVVEATITPGIVPPTSAQARVLHTLTANAPFEPKPLKVATIIKAATVGPFRIVNGHQKSDTSENVKLVNGEFLIFSKSSRLSKKHYDDWLLEKAESTFEQKTKAYCMELGIKPPQVIVKNLKNRWGSATKDNVININVNLLKAPENVIDYIILHELCHLKIKEHSHHFWDMLHKFMPDYQKQVEWLKINGSQLIEG